MLENWVNTQDEVREFYETDSDFVNNTMSQHLKVKNRHGDRIIYQLVRTSNGDYGFKSKLIGNTGQVIVVNSKTITCQTHECDGSLTDFENYTQNEGSEHGDR